MNILSLQPTLQQLNQIKDLHPPETVPTQVGQPEVILIVDDFQFIDSNG